MRLRLIILLSAAVGCFCRVSAQEAPHTELPDSSVVHRLAGFEGRTGNPHNTLMPLAVLPDIWGDAGRRGLYARRFGIGERRPEVSYIIAPKLPDCVKVLGVHPIVPRQLSISNGNAANWGIPYPSAYLDARTLSFPMRGCPRP